jgi:hypothetical protein
MINGDSFDLAVSFSRLFCVKLLTVRIAELHMKVSTFDNFTCMFSSERPCDRPPYINPSIPPHSSSITPHYLLFLKGACTNCMVCSKTFSSHIHDLPWVQFLKNQKPSSSIHVLGQSLHLGRLQMWPSRLLKDSRGIHLKISKLCKGKSVVLFKKRMNDYGMEVPGPLGFIVAS